MNRRRFVQAGAGALAAAPWIACSRQRTGIRVEHVSFAYEDYMYRTPIKFGGAIVDRVTLLNVDCVVRTPDGRTAKGFGSMPMGNVWSFPSQVLKYDQTLGAMKALAGKIAAVMNGYKEYGHPIDINVAVEAAFFKAAAEVKAEQQLAEAIPPLCTLVTASPFDAAVHDAFGKIHGRSTYQTYGPDLLPNDLSRYLGADYKGLRLNSFISPQPKPTMPLYHLVGAVDPLTDADNKNPIKDGLPETLPQWIEYNGLTHIKIKLNGDDLAWDVNRVLSVDRIATQTQAKRKVAQWYYSLDFNEKCRNVGYLLEFIQKVKAGSPAAFARIQYIEQPTARDLRAHRENVMHEVSKIVPVVIDESLIDLEIVDAGARDGIHGSGPQSVQRPVATPC